MPEYAWFSLDAMGEMFIKFTHKVTNLLWLWRTRLQVTQTLMAALASALIAWPYYSLVRLKGTS